MKESSYSNRRALRWQFSAYDSISNFLQPNKTSKHTNNQTLYLGSSAVWWLLDCFSSSIPQRLLNRSHTAHNPSRYPQHVILGMFFSAGCRARLIFMWPGAEISYSSVVSKRQIPESSSSSCVGVQGQKVTKSHHLPLALLFMRGSGGDRFRWKSYCFYVYFIMKLCMNY